MYIYVYMFIYICMYMYMYRCTFTLECLLVILGNRLFISLGHTLTFRKNSDISLKITNITKI